VKVLITLTDVEPAVRLNAQLESNGIQTTVVSPFEDLRGEIRRFKPDLIVITGNLRDADYQQIVRDQLWEGVSVIGLADVEDPLLREQLLTLGFTDVYTKPISADELYLAVRRVLDRKRLMEATGLIGQSEAIGEVLLKIEQIAPVSSTVIIEGESGTGKELVAHAIHRLSPRRNKPFIAVNAGALPETLIESELFGHEKGAFTGAAERRIGRFELADEGTLFLDEIGEIPPSTQVKLLRVLEERKLTRVGGTTPIPIDVRVVAATNRPLRESVEEGLFRADLYYRLNVLSMYLPPLRERREDIPILVRRFIKEFSSQHDRKFQGISAEAMQILMNYAWPGNVRELRNLIESMVVLAPGREIQAADIPRMIREGGGARFLPVHVGPVVRGAVGAEGRELEFLVRSMLELRLQVEELRRRMDEERDHRELWGNGSHEIHPPALASGGSAIAIEPPNQAPAPATLTLASGMTMAQIERAAIEAALRETRGNRRKAAEILDIGERTLYRKLRDYGIAPDEIGAR
jgi:DNA-binding NtrC family response regulator